MVGTSLTLGKKYMMERTVKRSMSGVNVLSVIAGAKRPMVVPTCTLPLSHHSLLTSQTSFGPVKLYP